MASCSSSYVMNMSERCAASWVDDSVCSSLRFAVLSRRFQSTVGNYLSSYWCSNNASSHNAHPSLIKFIPEAFNLMLFGLWRAALFPCPTGFRNFPFAHLQILNDIQIKSPMHHLYDPSALVADCLPRAIVLSLYYHGSYCSSSCATELFLLLIRLLLLL